MLCFYNTTFFKFKSISTFWIHSSIITFLVWFRFKRSRNISSPHLRYTFISHISCKFIHCYFCRSWFYISSHIRF
nr:MAG TPA: hypothetical protein [Caudoviricetes sp.]